MLKKAVLKTFAKFTERYLCRSILFQEESGDTWALSCEFCKAFENIFFILRISPYSVRMWENAGKMRTRIIPNTDTFYAVCFFSYQCFFSYHVCLWHRYFPVNFAKFLWTPFFTEHLRWLLLSNKIRKIHCRFLFSRKSITNMNSKSKREEKHSRFNTKTFNDFVWELVMRNSNKTAFSTV